MTCRNLQFNYYNNCNLTSHLKDAAPYLIRCYRECLLDHLECYYVTLACVEGAHQRGNDPPLAFVQRHLQRSGLHDAWRDLAEELGSEERNAWCSSANFILQPQIKLLHVRSDLSSGPLWYRHFQLLDVSPIPF